MICLTRAVSGTAQGEATLRKAISPGYKEAIMMTDRTATLIRNCEVCGSPEKKLIYRQRFITPSAKYVHGGYDIVVCSRCMFAFADNLPDQSFLDSYYVQTGGGTGTAVDVEPLHRHSAHNIASYLNKTDHVLDIGCGGGGLLALLAERGCRHLQGLEPGEQFCRAVKERYNINVVQGTVADHPPIGQFDFLIMNHVLEHIQDLRGTLVQLHSFLRPGGRVYIEVPDAYQLILPEEAGWDFAKDLFAQFCPEHVNFFTIVSLRNLMRRAGFSPIFLQSQMSTLGVIASVWTQTPIDPDEEIESHLVAYIKQSEAALDTVLPVIDRIVEHAEAIIVWGAGLHTQRLLSSTRLRDANILAFIDSNPAFRGQQLLGKQIVAPSELSTLPPVPLLISSRRLQDQIEQQILRLGLPNEVILLYPRGLEHS